MKLAARDVIYLAPLLLLALWFWPGTDSQRSLNQRVAAVTFFGVVVAVAVAAVIGRLYFEPRPFVSDSSTKLLINHSPDNSFPSDHASVAFAIAGAILVWRHRLGAGLLLIAMILSFARVYVGVHWPTDIMAAALIGLGVGTATALAVPLLATPQCRLSRFLPHQLITPPGPTT
jgi:undecaprenyl-diphosphatase